MKKLLAVYNICGINGRPNISRYINSIESILEQDLDDVEVVISSCLNSPADIMFLQSTFGDRITYNTVSEVLPVNVTFNHTVQKCVEKFGEFDSYLYIDSGINFQDQTDAFSKIYDLYKSGPYAMVAARSSGDTGFLTWFKEKRGIDTDDRGDSLFDEDNNMVLPLGTAINLHVQLFSNDLLKEYGNIIPDIFAGQCTESVFSFLCAAINKKWVIRGDVVLEHLTGMDGASAGFAPHLWEFQQKRNRWDHPFIIDSVVRVLKEGVPFGMGYEELQDIVPHNPDKFDEDGYAKDDGLKGFIRDYVFLNKDQLDYEQISHTFA